MIKPEDASQRAKDLMISLNCSSTLSNTDLLVCAQSAKPDVIINRILSLSNSIVDGSKFSFCHPIIDNIVFNQSIDSLLRSGQIKKGKIITGFNSDEFDLFLPLVWPLNAQNSYGYKGFHFKDFSNLTNKLLYYYPTYPTRLDSIILNEIVNQYFNMIELAKNLFYPVYINYFIQIMSDFWFVCSNFELAESYSNQKLDAYVYEIKHRPFDSEIPIYLGTTAHADDLIYTFALPLSNKVNIYLVINKY